MKIHVNCIPLAIILLQQIERWSKVNVVMFQLQVVLSIQCVHSHGDEKKCHWMPNGTLIN